MRQITDQFLLLVTEASATLIGLFLVGVFFYVEPGRGRWNDHARTVLLPYLRAGTRIVLILFTMPLVLSLTLVAFDLVWSRVMFALLSVVLIVANVGSAVRVRGVGAATRSPAWLANEVAGTVAVVVLVTIPWILGGFHPSREDLTLAILLAFGTGFLSIAVMVLPAFDIARPDEDRSQPLQSTKRST